MPVESAEAFQDTIYMESQSNGRQYVESNTRSLSRLLPSSWTDHPMATKSRFPLHWTPYGAGSSQLFRHSLEWSLLNVLADAHSTRRAIWIKDHHVLEPVASATCIVVN